MGGGVRGGRGSNPVGIDRSRKIPLPAALGNLRPGRTNQDRGAAPYPTRLYAGRGSSRSASSLAINPYVAHMYPEQIRKGCLPSLDSDLICPDTGKSLLGGTQNLYG